MPNHVSAHCVVPTEGGKVVSPVFKVGGSTLLRLNYSLKDFVGRARTKELGLTSVSLFMRLRKAPFGAAVSLPPERRGPYSSLPPDLL